MTFQLYLPETSFHFSLFMLHVLIFFLRCHPAPDVTLRVVHVQNLSCFLCQRRLASTEFTCMRRSVTSLWTVDFEIPNAFAVCLTVALFSII